MKVNNISKKIIDCIKSKKGTDITILDVRKLSSLTDYFIICTSESDPQTKAISSHVERSLRKNGVKPISSSNF